jgi:UDP-glucose 4-epimerase
MLVAVTGADGFIGSHIVEHLLSEGLEVRALVQYNSFDSSGWIQHLSDQHRPDLDVWYGDIRDYEQMVRFTDGCRVIYHLAALISVPYSFTCAQQFMDTNVRGTINILEAVARTGAKLVHISTSEVYGTAQDTPMTEHHQISPQSPYAASKVAADAFVVAYEKTYAIPVTIIRPFNTYGPRQSQRAVIPKIIAQFNEFTKHGTPIVLGDLRPSRDFLYVKDTVAGIAMARGVRKIGPFNLATGNHVTIGSIVRLAASIFDVRDLPKNLITNDPSSVRPMDAEVGCLVGDASRFKKETGWSPKTSIEEGFITTARWFTENNIKVRTGLI